MTEDDFTNILKPQMSAEPKKRVSGQGQKGGGND